MTAPGGAGGPEGSCASGVTTGPEGLPWPAGDPDQLRVSAQHAVGLAEETERQRAALLATGQGINPWAGIAHQSYLGELDRHVRAADRISVNFRQAAGGLADLAGVLDQAQESVRRLAAQLSEAREAARRAARRAEHARAEATAAAQHAAAVAPVSGGLDPAAGQAQAAEESALAAEAEAAHTAERAQQAERHCQEQAEQACAEARRQDQRSAKTIEPGGDSTSPDVLWGAGVTAGFVAGKMDGWAGGVQYLAKTGQVSREWLRPAKWAGRAIRAGGGGISVATSGLSQWFQDQRRHPGMDTDERAGRAATQGVTVGGASFVSGVAAGAAVGSVVPVAGTVVGGVVGAGVAVGAGLLVDKFNDGSVRWVGNRADEWGDAVGKGLGQAKDRAGNKTRDVVEAGGKAVDKLTFWD